MTKIAVLDLETTGDDPEDGDVPIEAGIVFLNDAKVHSQWHSLIDPRGRAISPVARASHHLSDDQVCMGIRPKLGFWTMMVCDCEYMAAHFAQFDKAFLPELADKPWICTYRCALHLYPDAPKHSLQVLRYHLNLKPKLPNKLTPHRALYDAHCTASLLQHMMLEKGYTAGELLDLTTAPLLLSQVRFGKHRGTPWADLPMDYLHWVLRQDFDEDTKHTARHYIEETRRRQSSVPEVPEQQSCG